MLNSRLLQASHDRRDLESRASIAVSSFAATCLRVEDQASTSSLAYHAPSRFRTFNAKAPRRENAFARGRRSKGLSRSQINIEEPDFWFHTGWRNRLKGLKWVMTNVEWSKSERSPKSENGGIFRRQCDEFDHNPFSVNLKSCWSLTPKSSVKMDIRWIWA